MNENYEDIDFWKLFLEALLLSAAEKDENEKNKKEEKTVEEEKKEKEEKEKIKNKETKEETKKNYESSKENEFLKQLDNAFKRNAEAADEYNKSLRILANLIRNGTLELKNGNRESKWISSNDSSCSYCENCKHEVWLRTRYCCECGCKMKNARTMIFGA